MRFVIANRSFLTVLFSEEANMSARFARALAAQKDGYDQSVESVVADGIRRGAPTFRSYWRASFDAIHQYRERAVAPTPRH